MLTVTFPCRLLH